MPKRIILVRPERHRAVEYARSSSVLAEGVPSHVHAHAHPAVPTPPHAGLTPSPLKGVAVRTQPCAALPAHGAARVRVREAQGNMDDLLAQASRLNAADRRELLARLALAEQQSKGEDRDLDMWSSSLYEALVRDAGRASGTVPGPMVIRQLVSPPSLWGPLRDFMSASGLSGLSVAERRSVYGLLARLLVEDAREFADWSRAPMGPRLAAQRAVGIAGVFDRAFPGYLRSGLAPFVARRLASGAAA